MTAVMRVAGTPGLAFEFPAEPAQVMPVEADPADLTNLQWQYVQSQSSPFCDNRPLRLLLNIVSNGALSFIVNRGSNCALGAITVTLTSPAFQGGTVAPIGATGLAAVPPGRLPAAALTPPIEASLAGNTITITAGPYTSANANGIDPQAWQLSALVRAARCITRVATHAAAARTLVRGLHVLAAPATATPRLLAPATRRLAAGAAAAPVSPLHAAQRVRRPAAGGRLRLVRVRVRVLAGVCVRACEATCV
jgi:hypothetical protein